MTPQENNVTLGTLVYMAQQAGWKPGLNRFKMDALRQKRRFKPLPWGELHTLPKREYLVKGLLDKGGMSVMYGASNCGKTFLALDITLHIAMGKAWRGQKTCQGAVVYIAAEGGMGLEDRLKAFRTHHQLSDYPPFYLIPTAADLCNGDADVEELIEEIRQVPNVTLIVIDTLSRAMAGGNENAPDDMGAVVWNGDRLKGEFGAHIMFIHHSGKDEGKGARGHSALKAAVDTEIEVKKGESLSVVAEVTKQRDGKTGVKYGFTLTPLPIGLDEDGEPKVSCILTPSDVVAAKKPLSRQKKKAVEVLQETINELGVKRTMKHGLPDTVCIALKEFQDALLTSGLSAADKPDDRKRAVRRITAELNNGGIVGISGDFIWLTDKAG